MQPRAGFAVELMAAEPLVQDPIALAWGAVHHFLVVPVLTRGGSAPRLSRSLLGESAVGMAILLAAAVLVDSRPPPQPAPAPAQAASVARR